MGLFSGIFGCNQPARHAVEVSKAPQASVFVSEADFAKIRAKQIEMAPQIMKQLRGYGVTDESKLKLEYFFYTNTKQKAEALAKELANRGYDGGHAAAASDSSQFVITGWTTPLQMSDGGVAGWAEKMCDLGYKFDCDFDGWGTNPNP